MTLRYRRPLLAALGLALVAATPAAAHRMWIVPSAGTLSSDGYVTFDAAISNELFHPDHFPMRLEQVKVWAPDGSEAPMENPATGKYRSTFDVHLDRPGTWKIGMVSSGAMGSYMLDGKEQRFGRGPNAPAGPPEGATDVKLAETMARNEVFVTQGAPTRTVFRPTGQGLELQPVTHPNDLVAGEPATFRFLVDGRPAPNLEVSVLPGGRRYRADEGGMALKTDARGEIAVKFPVAGLYWMNANAKDARVRTPGATERRLAYTTTLEVMAP